MRRHLSGDQCVFAFILQLKDMADAMKFRDEIWFAKRDPEMQTQPPGAECRLQSFDKLIDTAPGSGRNRDASGKSPAINRSQLRVFQQIDLVENDQCLFAKGIEFLDH